MALFEGYERRMPQIQPVLDKYGFKDFDDVKEFNLSKGVDAYAITEGIQPICFENAKWAYTLGAAIALKKGVKTAAEAAECIGEGLQALADALGGLGGGLDALLQRDGRAQGVGPLGVLEADGLDALGDGVGVHALGQVEFLYVVKILEAVLVEHRLDLRHSSLVSFKQSHFCAPPITACAGRWSEPRRPRASRGRRCRCSSRRPRWGSCPS